MRNYRSLAEIESNSGTYVLWFVLREEKIVNRLSRPQWYFPAGLYSYVGRDSRHLKSRLKRHLQSKKKRHWHIDWLLSGENFEICEIWIFRNHPEWECKVNQALETQSGAKIPAKRFGASDCKNGCRAHLEWHSHKVEPFGFIFQPNCVVRLTTRSGQNAVD